MIATEEARGLAANSRGGGILIDGSRAKGKAETSRMTCNICVRTIAIDLRDVVAGVVDVEALLTCGAHISAGTAIIGVARQGRARTGAACEARIAEVFAPRSAAGESLASSGRVRHLRANISAAPAIVEVACQVGTSIATKV